MFKRLNTLTGDVDFKIVKSAKRGNDVYCWKLKKLFENYEVSEDFEFFNPLDRSSRHNTRAVFLSLTYDRDLPIWEAWDRIGRDWNRFVTGLREKYGDLEYIRCWEAQGDGYPHIHALILFEDKEFDAFFHYNKRKKEGKWRIQGKDDFVSAWHWGFSDIWAVSCLNEGLDYIKKYLIKSHHKRNEVGSEPTMAEITVSLLWLYQKQAYAISGSYLDLIISMDNSKSVKPHWIDVGVNEAHRLYVWTLRGFWGGSFGGAWSKFVDLGVFLGMKGHKSWSDNRYL